MTTLEQGIHDGVPMEVYIGDPCPAPSLSTGVVQTLVERTPMHAWHEHPRLGGNPSEATARGDIGSAVHALVLGGAEVEYGASEWADWRKKDAQVWRDEAREAGRLPLLHRQRDQVEAAAEAARAVLATFGPGRAEQTMLWQMDGVWARARADWLVTEAMYDIDIKTTDSAEPASWIRRVLLPGGLDIQAALRVTGHEAITGRTRDVLFLLVELEPPHATCVVGVSPKLLEFARRKIAMATRLWRRCLAEKRWPGYGDQVRWAEPTAWAEWDFEAREISVASAEAAE